MVGLDKALEGWLETVASIGDLTPAEQAKITTAGAKVFQKELEEVTREKHYSNKKHLKYGHMADGLSVQSTNADGRKNGVATVGWKNNYHAQNARRLMMAPRNTVPIISLPMSKTIVTFKRKCY